MTLYYVEGAPDDLDDEDSCRPYEPNDRCGGCGECLLMQAHWYGCEVFPFYGPKFEYRHPTVFDHLLMEE